MWNDTNWFFTDEPTAMWGRQLEYRKTWINGEHQMAVVTPNGRRFLSLRRAFALYRVGLDDRGPDDAELEVMRKTLAWLNCARYEYQHVANGARCPARSRLARLDNRRVICDVFAGSPALYESYLRYLEMLRLVTMLPGGVPGPSREGQSALVMLELTRPRSGFYCAVHSLANRQQQGNWITVDASRWTAGLLVVEKGR